MAEDSGYYDCVYPMPDPNGSDKTIWVTIGRAFPGKNKSISIRINALPISKDWDGKLILFYHDEGYRKNNKKEKSEEIHSHDDIPF
jgi:hypothetical protein